MFCPKCGTQNASGARFCGKCGEPMGPAAKVPVVSHGSSNSGSAVVSGALGFLKDNRKLVSMIAAVLAVVLLFSLVFGGRGYKKTVDNFMDSFMDMDAKGMVAMMPDEVLEMALEEEGYSKKDLKRLISELQEELDYGMSAMKMFGDYKMDYKILGAEDVSKEDLADLKETYSEIGVKVSGAKEVEVEMTVEVMGMSQSETIELVVIKIGRSWYIEIDSMGSLL